MRPSQPPSRTAHFSFQAIRHLPSTDDGVRAGSCFLMSDRGEIGEEKWAKIAQRREYMRNMLLCLVALMAAAQAKTDQIDDIVTEQMKISHLPGVAVAIIDNGRVTKLATYGEANLEWPAKVIRTRGFSSRRRPSC